MRADIAPGTPSAARDTALARHERAMAAATGAAWAVGFGYARTGLAAVLQACGLEAGDEVLLSPLTCKVVPLSLISAGLKPVYVDVAAGSLNLDPARLATATGAATQAVLFQHTYGSTTGIDATAAYCRERGLLLVEDCAQCMPHTSAAAGRQGRAALYSNNLRKPLPAGSGAIVTTDDPRLARELARRRDALPARTRGAELALAASAVLQSLLLGPRLYWPLFTLARASGAVYRDEAVEHEIATQIVQAAVQPSERQSRRGDAWLRRADALARHRIEACAHYTELLGSAASIVLPVRDPGLPLYFFPVLTPAKQMLLRHARAHLLEVVAWPMRLPIYPAEHEHEMQRYGYTLGSCPEAERIAERLVGLPTDFGATPWLRRALASLILDVRA
jgi:dTDP-4-amino-4,6-dideoxygalactose transaminase